MTCCEKQNINRMDYRIHGDHAHIVINRICLSCGKHWHGIDGGVREFTRKEWDDFVGEVKQ